MGRGVVVIVIIVVIIGGGDGCPPALVASALVMIWLRECNGLVECVLSW